MTTDEKVFAKKARPQKTDKCADVLAYPGIKTFPEIAQALGVSTQAVNQMYHRGLFKRVWRVGTAVLVVSDMEAEEIVASRQGKYRRGLK